MKSTFPNINKKIAISNTKFIPRYLNDKTIVDKNLEINKNIVEERNGFLKAIIILQEDIVDNFFKFDCIEQDFNLADSEKTGKASYFKFNSILKKRLFNLRDKNFEKFIDLAHEGLDKNVKEELKNEKMIDYRNFLNNLINYNEEIGLHKSWESEEKKVEIEEKEEEKEKENKLGGTAIEESKVDKDDVDELGEFNTFSQNAGDNNTNKDKKNEDKDDTRRNNEEDKEKSREYLLDNESEKEEKENKEENKNENTNNNIDSEGNKDFNNNDNNNLGEKKSDDIKELEETNNNIDILQNNDGLNPIIPKEDNIDKDKNKDKDKESIQIGNDAIEE
jgi:hypothetical protein